MIELTILNNQHGGNTMKKIAFMLAMILCVLPMLTACGGASGAEKVVEKSMEAMYVDFDYENFYETVYELDLDLLEDVFEGDKLDAAKETARAQRDSVKEMVKGIQDRAEDMEDFEIVIEIRYSQFFEKDSDEYDAMMEEFSFKGTDMEDLVDATAVVGVVMEAYVTDEDGVETIDGQYQEVECYKIDGTWYVGM